jgi:parallel beta-helix repeat protein
VLRTLSRMAAATRIAVGASAASMILVTSVILVASAGPATATAQAPGRAAAPATVQSAVVSTLSDGGAGSLRAAIIAANASAPGTTTNISFSVSGTITLASALPVISGQVVIDGTSAPGYVSGGAPVVEVDCNNWAGLRFAAGSDGSQLLGLAVDNASGNGVTIGASSVTLNYNYIGLDMNGTAAGNRGAGVYVLPGSSGNAIGRNPSGDSEAVANVISGNAGSGVVLAGSSGNTVAANRIGTDPSGQSSISNGGNGIWLTAGANRNEIGGTAYVDQATGQTNNPTGSKGTVTPVFVVPPDGNLISGNAANGVLIDRNSSGNSLNGNFVGTTADGDGGLGNGGNGVWIDGAGNNSLTGCKFANNPFVYYNVLSGNDQNGLRITNSNNVTVQGNFLGVGANNTTLLGNRLDGVRVEGTSANTQVGGVIPLGNVSSGNGRNGIAVTGRVHGFETFNTFGGLLAFKGAAPNGNDGLLITSSRGGNLVRTNVFSGNRRNGIELAGHEYGVKIDPNIVGLNTKGNGRLANGGDGVRIDGDAHGNLLGGTLKSVIPQNTFSGNRGYGLAIVGHAHANLVERTFIGTKILGVEALGNRKGGILLGGRSYFNSIGSKHPRPSNLISGNRGNGVTLRRGAHATRVINNYIGLNRFGRCLPNSRRGLVNRGRAILTAGNRYNCGRHRSRASQPASERFQWHSIRDGVRPRPAR